MFAEGTPAVQPPSPSKATRVGWLLAAAAGLSAFAAGCGDNPETTGDRQRGGAAAAPPARDPGTQPPRSGFTLRPPAPAAGSAADRVLSKTFDDIKFDIEPDAPFSRSMLTDQIEELDGRRVRIRGWILPSARRRGLRSFVLVRDNQECCFGPGAALYDCVLVTMAPGKTAEFSVKPVAVEGRFRIEEFTLGGRTMAVFQMEGERVEQ